MRALTFKELRAANESRCEGAFQPLNDWSETDWACALAGEVGELCNLIKKRRRGDRNAEGDPLPDDCFMRDIGREIADIQIYLDLISQRLGLVLEDEVVAKFNEVSRKRGSDVRIGQPLDGKLERCGLVGCACCAQLCDDTISDEPTP